MFAKIFYAYSTKRVIGRNDGYKRLALVQQFLVDQFGMREEQPAEVSLIEGPPYDRHEVISFFQHRRTSRRKKTPTFICYSWKDIDDDRLMSFFITRSITVIVLELLQQGEDELSDFVVLDDGVTLEDGKILYHARRNLGRMEEVLAGRKRTQNNRSNDRRHAKAVREAERTWRLIESAARRHKITSMTGVVKQFEMDDVRKENGSRFTQPDITRCIERANKKTEWRELKQSIKDEIRSDLFPDTIKPL